MDAPHDLSVPDLRLLVDGLPGLVVTFTPGGDLEFVNRQMLEYFGRSLEALRQWQAGGTAHPEDLPRVVDIFTQSIASGEPFEIETRARRYDGVYRWFQARGLPCRDSNSRILRWCVLLTDIHDLRARSELDDAGRVATIRTLTASIAHDINQPLSGIITNAGTCLRMLDTHPPNLEGARETVRRTIRDANRASEMTTRLRALFITPPDT